MKNLSGSEKQVAWAEDIRRDMLDMMTEASNLYAEALEAERSGKNRERIVSRFESSKAAIDGGIKSIAGVDSSKWFIDNRGFTVSRLFDGTYHVRANADTPTGEANSIKAFNSSLKKAAEGIAKSVA